MTGAGPEAGDRFESSATKFLFRMLADPKHPFSIPADFHAHWFQSHSRRDE
ncbi:hypothetical protein [Streptomyces sp. NPDC048496]|uniref:hypothetical protein n=1 Tax=Streptomyces sp. NPDC048496 TaxID=3365558 RepID=UPI0037242233